jgi:predicted AAA+ superfamily ATPase
MARHLKRAHDLAHLDALLKRSPIVAVLGPRQSGKTTLARDYARAMGGQASVFDLEDDGDLARLADPLLALRPLRGLVLLDEIQRRPELFPALRVLADRPASTARFLVLGSASPHLLRQASESLAGRIAFHELGGFGLDDVGEAALDRLWLRGGFPRAFLARSNGESHAWRRDFVKTFVERDLPQLGVGASGPTIERFWAMLAHWHAQVWNASEFARSFGVSEATVRRYLDLLEATFVVRRLKPWSENLAKRQVKSPKVYVADSGLLHALLATEARHDLERHPKLGASWEGFAITCIIRQLGARPEEVFFWSTHAGAELDLLVVRGRQRLGFEIKRTSAPALTRSMHVAMADLRLSRLDVVHAGDHTFALGPRVRALPLRRLLRDLDPLR